MLDILVHGSQGRMGSALINIINSTKDMQVVGCIDPLHGKEDVYPTFQSFAECNVPADVVIDFSSPTATKDLLEYCVNKWLPVVIATTGMGEDEEKLITEAINKIPVFRSANMSIGINLVAKAIKEIAPTLEEDFHVEIVEKHHAMKKDSPSGTALLLAKAIDEAMDEPKEYIYGRHGIEDDCPKSQMAIHAVRGGTIVGEHNVIFAGPEEIIEIKHTALSRQVFAQGALKAARYIVGKKPGLYTMGNLVENE